MEVLNFKTHKVLNMCCASSATQICGTKVTSGGPWREAQGLAWNTNPGSLRSCLSSESSSHINHRMSRLLLFLSDCPASLTRPDTERGKKTFGSPGTYENQSCFKKALIQNVSSSDTTLWKQNLASLLQNFLGWWDISEFTPKIQREGSPHHISQKKGSFGRMFLKPALYWILEECSLNTYINSLRSWSRDPFSKTSSNLRRITWIFLGKIGKGQREWIVCSEWLSPILGLHLEVSPSLLTWPVAHSLWHAGRICSFPSLAQSVAPEHWGKSTSGPSWLQSLSSLWLTHFRNENENTSSLKEQIVLSAQVCPRHRHLRLQHVISRK